MADEKFYGKYRGTVDNNADPRMMGRVMVTVPNVSAASGAWALPCVPVAGAMMGMYAIPPVGASVWVEFEQGNPENPIWSGCFWSSAISSPAEISSVVLRTGNGNQIIISDTPGAQGGIIIKSMNGASVIVNDAGISLDNGKGATITMVGQTVNANNGAFTVI